MAEKDGGGGRYLYEQYSTPLSTSTPCGAGGLPGAVLGAKPQNNGLTMVGGGVAQQTISTASTGTGTSSTTTMPTSMLTGSLNNVVEPPSTMMLKSQAAMGATTKQGGDAGGTGTTTGAVHGRRSCCSACTSPAATSFWVGLLANLGICTLLLAYTLLGSFIFLAIEGGAASGLLYQQQQRPPLASTNRQPSTGGDGSDSGGNGAIIGAGRPDNMSLSTASILDTSAARQRTVESIWDITVSLNILYRENWTRLAALEIARFQDQLIERITSEMTAHLEGSTSSAAASSSSAAAPQTGAVMVLHHGAQYADNGADWTFARAFLYSLTVLTTIGHGNIAPRTTLGRIVTMVYALVGIPLTLVYLSSTGGVLAKVARGVFSRALCCCLCSNCGYCCYDEKRMAEKERRMRKKREHAELRAQQLAMQEPYYVRAGSLHNNLHSPSAEKQQAAAAAAAAAGPPMSTICDLTDSISVCESRTSMHGLSILAPILLCFSIMLVYIVLGALALYQLEQWPLLDGVYFCFMSLSTIGFGDLVPGLRREAASTTWFCSAYIMSGMALTAMCFNVLHEELAHRVKRVVDVKARMAHRGSGVAGAVGSCGGGGGVGGGCGGGGGGGNGGGEDPSDYLGS